MRRTQPVVLPDDVKECHDEIIKLTSRLAQVEDRVDALLRLVYGRKTEKIAPGQLNLFEDEPAKSSDPEPEVETVTRRKLGHGRRKPNEELPRDRRLYDLPEEEQCCPCCLGERVVIGEEVSEQFDYTPSSVRIIEHVRIKRACRKCGSSPVLGEKPADVIPKGLASADMLAYIATAKFADHLPLNRLENIFKRDGASIARSTMCDWMLATSVLLKPLYERLVQRVTQSEIVWTDDTPVKMLDRTDERNIRNARVWVYIGDRRNPYTVFSFTKSRKRDGPQSFLKNFSGYLQADAFAGYDCIYSAGEVTEVACWAHARRKFFDAMPTNAKACAEVIRLIQELYLVENDDCDSGEMQARRQLRSVPILAKIKNWLDQHRLTALPKSPLGRAITYALNNWNALTTFVSNGELSIDNNVSERALRSMAIGRKNWLFVGSEKGGETAAVISSILATCKQHSIHPRIYLSDVLKRLAKGEKDLDLLLPDRWTATCS